MLTPSKTSIASLWSDSKGQRVRTCLWCCPPFESTANHRKGKRKYCVNCFIGTDWTPFSIAPCHFASVVAMATLPARSVDTVDMVCACGGGWEVPKEQ